MLASARIKACINRLEILDFWKSIPNGLKRLYAEELARYHDSTVQTVYSSIRKIRDNIEIKGVTALDIAVSLQVLAENQTTNPLHIDETLNLKTLNHECVNF